MSGLTFRLKANPGERLNIAELTPSKLAKLSSGEIARLKVGMGKNVITVGDAFDVSGTAGDTITIEGSGVPLDFAGAGLDGGTLRISG